LEDNPASIFTSDEPQDVPSPLARFFETVFGNVNVSEDDNSLDEPSDDTEETFDVIVEEEKEPCGLHDVVEISSSNVNPSTVTIELETTDNSDEFDEDDPDVMLAVCDVLSTPQSISAEDQAVDLVLSVQEECSADFGRYCTDIDTPVGLDVNNMPSFGNDISSIFNSMHSTLTVPTFGDEYVSEGNFFPFRRKLIETERKQKKLESRSAGLKQIREIRDKVLASIQIFADAKASAKNTRGSAVRRELKSKSRAESGNTSRRSPSASKGLPTTEKLRRKAELEKLSKMRSEYNYNPNRTKLSTRLSRVASPAVTEATTEAATEAATEAVADSSMETATSRKLPGLLVGPPDRAPKPKPKPMPDNSAPRKPSPGYMGPGPRPDQPKSGDRDPRWTSYPRVGAVSGDDGDDYGDIDVDAGEPEENTLPPDNIYGGSLGFGEEGDACMYKAYPRLSQTCKGAISDLYDFRDNFYAASQPSIIHPYHRHHGFFLFGLLIFGLIFFTISYKRDKKTKQIRKILDVIDANPNLKSQVQELAGCDIPEHNSGWKSIGSLVRSSLQNGCKLVTLIIASIFVVVTSLITTCLILAAMSKPPVGCEEHPPVAGHGEDIDDECSREGPGIIVALLLLFAIASAEVYILYFLVTACKSLRRRRNLASASSEGNSPNLSDSYFSYPSESHAGDYVALSGTEHFEHQQELASMGPAPPTVVPDDHNQHYAQYSHPVTPKDPGQQQPRLPEGVVTGKLVRAVPVSSINYI